LFSVNKSVFIGEQPRLIGLTTDYILDELAGFWDLVHRAPGLNLDELRSDDIFYLNAMRQQTFNVNLGKSLLNKQFLDHQG